MSTRETVLAEIEKFLRETRMSATQFGDKSINDRALVKRLREGRDLTTGTVDKIRAFMRQERTRKRPKSGPDRAAACA